MKIANTTGDLGRFPISDQQRVRILSEAGFHYIDLCLYSCNQPGSWLLQDDWQEQALALKAYAESLGCTFVQAHGPSINPLDLKDPENDMLCMRRALEDCGLLGYWPRQSGRQRSIRRYSGHGGSSPGHPFQRQPGAKG